MARERPIKLHMKDGKPAGFRLIGPKGRVLNSLKWDGETLSLTDASAEVTEQVTPHIDEGAESTDSVDAPIQDNQSGDTPPPISEPPVPQEDTKDVDAAPPEVEEDVSGPSEKPLSDDDLQEILDDEKTPKAADDKDEVPIKVDANIPGNPKEPSGWLVKGKDKIAIMAMDDESDDDAIERVQKKHPGYDLHKGPKEPEDTANEKSEEDADSKQKD